MTATGIANQADPVRWALVRTPDTWRLRRLKHVALVNTHSLPEDTDPEHAFGYIDIGAVDSLGHVTEMRPMTFAEAPSRARRLVAPGDVLVSTVRTYLRAIAKAPIDCADVVVSTGFAVVTPGQGVNGDFLYWWLRSTPFVEEVVARSVGVSYPAVNAHDVMDIAVPIPALGEQKLLAAYLDEQCARIDELVTEQERQIALAEERRFAYVSRTLGARVGGPVGSLETAISELLIGWRFVPLKHVAAIQNGLTLGHTYDEPIKEYPYLRVANVQRGVIDLTDVTTISIPAEVARRHELRPGDVLMTEGNGNPDNLGRGSVWNGEIPGCLHQNHIFAVRPKSEALDSAYLAYMMASSWGRPYFRATSNQVGIATTSRAKVAGFPIPLPPLSEQRRILEEMRKATSRLDAVVEEARRQVTLLEERRQALITAAVTGQLNMERLDDADSDP